jgi:yecA family protein
MLARTAEEMDALDVTPEILEPALAAALAEGQALGEPPAHGLVDVVEVCGIRELRPVPMSVGDWIARLDPDGELSRLSPQKLGRLINSSADWPDDYDLLQSWFEDSAAVRDILINAITPRSREAALWRHLETRREWWARLIAKTAAMLKTGADEPEDGWKSFAATAQALIKGRPLRKIPIMTSIVVESLESADDPWMRLTEDADDTGHPPSEDDVMPVAFSHPAPEKEGELKHVMETASMDIMPEWLDGYLAAIIVSPKPVAPSGWISGLLEQKHDFADHDELQRFLDLVLMRYNAANADMADPAVTDARIKAHDARGLRRWAEGFTESVARHKGEWTARTVTGEDKRVLRFIADAASGRAGASELKPLLPAWLTHRREARR